MFVGPRFIRMARDILRDDVCQDIGEYWSQIGWLNFHIIIWILK